MKGQQPVTPDIGRASIVGLAWLLLQNVGGRALNFLGQIVLAWLLSPADFGAIAIAYAITAVLSTIAGFGIEDVLLSRQRTLLRWAAPAFWLALGLSVVGVIAMLGAAALAPRIFGDATIGGLVAVLALTLPFSALSAIPTAFLRSRLKFRFLSSYALGELAATQIVAVVLAYCGFGPYSFAIPAVASAVLKAAIFWTLVRPPVKWRFRRVQCKFMIGSGATVFSQKLLLTLRNYGDSMVLGMVASSATVGFYFFAFKLAAVPIYSLTGSLGGVLLPALAHLKGDPRRQAAATVSASRVLALIVLPLSFLQAVIAEPALHLLFGDKWTGSVTLLQILSIGLGFDVVPCVAGALMGANGRFSANLRWSLVVTPIFLALVIIGAILASATGVALGVALFFVVSAPAYSYYALRACGCSPLEVLSIYLAPTACGAVAALAGFAAMQFSVVRSLDLLAIVASTLATLGVYSILIRIAVPTAVEEFTERLRTIFRRKRDIVASAPRGYF